MSTSADQTVASIDHRACFGAGCYWGTEKFFKHDFGVKTFIDGSGKVVSGQVGFMGPPGAKENPLYPEVKTGTTSHVEVYDIIFEGDENTYENLVKHFFMFHDPTTLNRQGEDDIGTQYASTIFVYDQKQREIAERVKSELQQLIDAGKVKYKNNEVTTAILDATVFWPAHEEHQEYLDKNPAGYCNHRYRFKEWPSL